MCGADTVTIETVLGYREADLHSIGGSRGVTRPAVEQGICATDSAHRLGVDPVGKTQVGWRRIGGRAPAHGLFDDPVVTVGTCGRVGPERVRLILCSSVAACAFGKEIAVLPVIEAIRHLGGASLHQEKGQESRPQSAGPNHDPARGRVRNARGRGA